MISLYIQRILGVDQSESFDYKLVNQILPIDLKIYIKKIACYPQLVNKEIYDKADTICLTGKKEKSIKLTVKDKVFINLLVCEAKRMTSLLFLSKAIADHLKW